MTTTPPTTGPPTTLFDGLLDSQIVLEILAQGAGADIGLQSSQVAIEVLAQGAGTDIGLRASQLVMEVLRENPPNLTTPVPTTAPPTTLAPTTAGPTSLAPTTPGPTTPVPTTLPPTTAAPTTILTTSGPDWTALPDTLAPYTIGGHTTYNPEMPDKWTTAYPQQIVPTSCAPSAGSVKVAQAPIEMPAHIITDAQVSQFGVEILIGNLGANAGGGGGIGIPLTIAPWTLPPTEGDPTGNVPLYPYDSIGFIEDDV